MKEIKDTISNSYVFASERAAAKQNDPHRHWEPAECTTRPRGHEARKPKGEKKMGLNAGDKLQMQMVTELQAGTHAYSKDEIMRMLHDNRTSYFQEL